MAATTTPPEANLPPDAPITRFDRVERTAHWVNAALFGIVMLTGSVLYIGQLSVLVGNREIVRAIHVYCGLAIPVAFLVAYFPRWGKALRRDFNRINRWTQDDKGAFGMRILQDPDFGRELEAGMGLVGEIMEPAMKIGDESVDPVERCRSLIAIQGAFQRITASVELQWGIIDRLFAAEAARLGVALE